MTERSSFKPFKTSPEIIPLAVKSYIRFPLSFGNVEGLLHDRGVDVSHETVRHCWRRGTAARGESGPHGGGRPKSACAVP